MAWLGLLGATIATFCDAFHAHTRTLVYPNPVWFEQAWWVFPLFAVCFFTTGLGYRLVIAALPLALVCERSQSPGTARAMVEAAMLFVFVYLLSAYGSGEPETLSVIFYGAFALRWSFTYERGWLLILAVTLALGGMGVEGLLGAQGLVAYSHQDVYHVPLWLGGLYMHGAYTLREGMRLLVYRDAAAPGVAIEPGEA